MWIFTQDGYVSVVQHFSPSPGAELLVRARARRHLKRVLGLAMPASRVDLLMQSTPDHDYPWRAAVDRTVVRDILVASVEQLGYSNFKARAADTLGADDAHVLGDIWLDTHGFTANEQGGSR